MYLIHACWYVGDYRVSKTIFNLYLRRDDESRDFIFIPEPITDGPSLVLIKAAPLHGPHLTATVISIRFIRI